MHIESCFGPLSETTNHSMNEIWTTRAKNELGETPHVLETSLVDFKQELISTLNCHHSHFQDEVLIRFLRARKFDTQKACELFRRYRQMKQQSASLFRVSPVTDMEFVLEMDIQTALPINEEFGRQVYVYRVANLDPYKVPVDYVFRSNILWFETLIRQEETQIGGIIVILDMTGVRLAHARYLTPHLARRTVEVVQEVFPMRFKSFHVIHEPFYFSTILNMLKPFLKDKIRRRIFTHGSNMISLQKHIPRQYLPEEYGGEAQMTLSNSHWRQVILQNAQYYETLENKFANEAEISCEIDVHKRKESCV